MVTSSTTCLHWGHQQPKKLAFPFCAGSGDVKYHLGTSYDRPAVNGKTIRLALLANPSHLEAVNTVVLGKCRARQFYEDDDARIKTMPILLHGDGAFSGQVRCRFPAMHWARVRAQLSVDSL